MKTDLRQSLLRDGFVRLRQQIPRDVVSMLEETSDGVLAAVDNETRSRTKSQGSMVRLTADPRFADLVVLPQALSALAMLGYRTPAFSDGYLISKPPHSPRLFWHYDWFAWKERRSHDPEPLQVALMYYLTDTTRANGCLRVIPGSHIHHNELHDLLAEPHSKSLAAVEDPGNPAFGDRPDEVDVAVDAGDLLVVDARLLHASHANTTDQPRTMLTLWYQPDLDSLPPAIQAQMAAKAHVAPDDWPQEARDKWHSILVSYEGGADPIGRQLYQKLPDL